MIQEVHLGSELLLTSSSRGPRARRSQTLNESGVQRKTNKRGARPLGVKNKREESLTVGSGANHNNETES